MFRIMVITVFWMLPISLIRLIPAFTDEMLKLPILLSTISGLFCGGQVPVPLDPDPTSREGL